MLRRAVVAAALALVVPGCGTFDYKPEEYVLTEGRIAKFPLAGTVRVVNAQTDDAKRPLYQAGSAAQWMGDYKTLSEQLRSQLDTEIRKNGIARPGAAKTIEIKVTQIGIDYAWYRFSSRMGVTVALGDGQAFDLTAAQGSPGDMNRVINGTIAIAVIDILKDERVLAYLAR